MTRLTSQRGVSLLLLIVMVTVFAGVAIGVVTLLRSRHESYPYQVQSYQAYALAHAGAEFAIRFARENAASNGDYESFLQSYILSTGGKVNFGNGTFTLSYDRHGGGCGDEVLSSRGTCGTATRQVDLLGFGGLVAKAGGSPVRISGPIRKVLYEDCYGGVCYSGSRITFNVCDVTLKNVPQLGVGVPFGQVEGQYHDYPVTIAATRDNSSPTPKQVTLARVGFAGFGTGYIWDAACGSCTTGPGGTYPGPYPGQVLPAWDNISHPITPLASEYFQIVPVAHSAYAYDHFPTSDYNEYTGAAEARPRKGVPCDSNLSTCCDPNPNTCVLSPTDPNYFAPCCTGSYPPRPCCWAPQAFVSTDPNKSSYPNNTCIDPQPYSSAWPGPSPWMDRTDRMCTEAKRPGTVFIKIIKPGNGSVTIETIGDIVAPVTFYFQFAYQLVDDYGCRTNVAGAPNPPQYLCRSKYPPVLVTWVFTVN